MNVLNYADAHANLSETMDLICADQAPTMIIREKGEPVVMLPLSDYNSMIETMYLVSNPANAKRLSQSIAQHASFKPKNGL